MLINHKKMEDENIYFKEIFLKRYNQKKSIEDAISLAIRAAVQHNSLYLENLSMGKRKVVRTDWGKELLLIAEKYKENQTKEIFNEDILKLKEFMNTRHGDSFRRSPHPKYKYDIGFRISHSQKSISVFLKHLWCMNKISEPPVCPVDRIILEKIGESGKSASWGYINSLEIHNSKVAEINEFALKENKSIAIWELTNF
jgi:hypothetical protein